MSRIYQRKTKSKTNAKANNSNHEENEKVGMSYPAVGVSYKNNVSQLKAKEGNEETKDIIQLQNASSKIVNPLLSLNNNVQTPNQSKNPCLSKLFQKHNYIITNTKKHEKLINEGKSGKINFWYFNGQKPTTIEFIETQFLLSSEKEQYDKLSISCPDNESDPSFLKYLNLIEVLEPKIKLYDDIQAEKDRIDKQAEVDIDNIYIYGINRDLDNLFRSLQFSFPRRDKTREIFLKKYNYSNYYKSLDSFIKDMTNGGSGINWSMAQAYLNVGKLRPCDKFYIAVKGPGTDEGNMFFAMKEAHEYGIGKLDEDLREEYPDFNYGKSGLPHTGAGNDIWTVAAWIDSETSYGTDDRIKAKALLSYGRVRPIDEVRMALMKDTSKTDLKNALRKANVENLEIVLNENNDKCLTPEAEKKLVSDRLLDDYKFSYNSDLLGDIKRIHTSVNMSISGHITIPTSNSLYKVDEKGLNTANNIVFGNETKQEQYLDEKKYNKKLSISTFSNMSMEDKKIILDSMQTNLNNDKSKVEFNQLVGIWELEITDNPVYNIIKHNQLFDSNSFDNFVKYNLKIEQSKKLLKILSSDKEIGGIGLNIYNYLNTYLLKNSKLLWTYHYIGIDNLETAEKEMFQLVVNSKDKNWQTNYIMNVLSPEEKNYYKYYWKDLKYDSLKDAQTKDNFDHIKGLLNDDPTVRINAERKLLTKANSGLGASITNIGSTAGLSADNEQRELEVDLEMAKWNDGKIDKNEMAGLEKDILDAKETRENFEETRDTVENVATMIAQTLVTVLATVLIPGAGGLIAQAIINGIASAGTNWVMKGDRYSLKGGFSDLINGGISGAMGVIGSASVLKLAKVKEHLLIT
ncbi:MAG: hypothetical protein IPL95_12175 [Saprospiraceae bacterium]|nr:hypothetical protein [Saprospiraceae bacterium]